MSKTTIVRYRTRPESADENADLVRGVYAALAELAPPDFSYATYRLADDVTFVHVAVHANDSNPLATLPAFAEFQRNLRERCAEPPAPSSATLVGSYGLGGSDAIPVPPAPDPRAFGGSASTHIASSLPPSTHSETTHPEATRGPQRPDPAPRTTRGS